MQPILLIRIFLKMEALQKILGSALRVYVDFLSWSDVTVTFHVVKVKSQWLLTPDISVLSLPCIPACNLPLHTCSLARMADIAKYFALFFIVCWLPYTHTYCVDLSVNTAVQPGSPHCLTDPFISCGGRNEPTLPIWTDLTERDYFKACIDFLPCPLLPIPLPWKWLIQSALMRSDG